MCFIKSITKKKFTRNLLSLDHSEDKLNLQQVSFPLEIIDLPIKFNNPPCFSQSLNQNQTQSHIPQNHLQKTSLLSRKMANRDFTNISQDQVQLRSKSYNINKQRGLFENGNKINISRCSSEDKINSEMTLKMTHSEVSTRDSVRVQNHSSQKLMKRFAQNVNFSINKTSYDCFLQNQINKQSLKLSKQIEKQQRLIQLSDSKLSIKKMKRIPIFSPFLDESYKENQPKKANFRISKKRPQNEQCFPEQLMLGFTYERQNEIKKSTIKEDNEQKNKIYSMKRYMSHNIK